jgi:hypothetical protein
MALSEERRARLQQEQARNAGGSNFLKTKNRSVYTIRLCPGGANADGDVGIKVVSFFINKQSYVCNVGTHGKPGVLDRALKALKRLDDPEAQELAAGLEDNRSTKYVMKVVDREDPELRPCWYKAPYGVYKYIMETFNAGDECDSALEGYDFRISKDGAGKGTKYAVVPRKPSLLHEDKATRIAIKKAATEMDSGFLTAPDEKGALEALRDVIPKNIWKQIENEVTGGMKAAAGDDEDADSSSTADEDEEDTSASAKKKAAAAVEDDEDAPAAPAKAGKKPVAPVTDEDEDEPAPPKSGKKAPAAPAAEDDDEDAPVPPAKKKPAAAADDDEDAPVPPAKKKPAAAADDDEDEAPAPPAKKKPAPTASDDDEDDEPALPKAGKAAPAASDDEDEDDAPAPPKAGKKAPAASDDDEDDEPAAPPAKVGRKYKA